MWPFSLFVRRSKKTEEEAHRLTTESKRENFSPVSKVGLYNPGRAGSIVTNMRLEPIKLRGSNLRSVYNADSEEDSGADIVLASLLADEVSQLDSSGGLGSYDSGSSTCDTSSSIDTGSCSADGGGFSGGGD